MVEITFTERIKGTALRMNADFIGVADPVCFQNPEYTGNK
jgi:hypothetical protein